MEDRAREAGFLEVARLRSREPDPGWLIRRNLVGEEKLGSDISDLIFQYLVSARDKPPPSKP